MQRYNANRLTRTSRESYFEPEGATLMSDGLKWARRMRLDVAVEIEQMESGVRMVTQITPQGPVDITEQALAALKARFEQLESMIAAFGPSTLYD